MSPQTVPHPPVMAVVSLACREGEHEICSGYRDAAGGYVRECHCPCACNAITAHFDAGTRPPWRHR